jgi:hypothetical protein
MTIEGAIYIYIYLACSRTLALSHEHFSSLWDYISPLCSPYAILLDVNITQLPLGSLHHISNFCSRPQNAHLKPII